MKKEPLVSVLIPNYNYSRYLANCFDSLLNQTYRNFEVIFRDNNSTDDSYAVALSYQKKFEEAGIYFSVSRNKRNMGSDTNSDLCRKDSEGDLMYTMGSDDAIKPTFLEKCVRIFQEYPNVGMVMTHREEIDDDDNITEEVPFYNCDCVIPGEAQATVFMMAGIAIPSQRMVRRGQLIEMTKYMQSMQVAGDWFYNFLYSCCCDIAYIKEPLCQYRVHRGNETNESELNLLGILEHIHIVNTFVDISNSIGYTKPQKRLPEAMNKLASMCLRYALKMIKINRKDVAGRYMLMSTVINPNMVNDNIYCKLQEILNLEDATKVNAEIHKLENEKFAKRTVSYDPPEGYVEVKL